MSESPQKSLHMIDSKFVKHDLHCLTTDLERRLDQPCWAARPAVTRPGCPRGSRGRWVTTRPAGSAPAAMAPEADKGLRHVTQATALERNCHRARIIPDVQFREPIPIPTLQRQHSTISCGDPSLAVLPDQSPNAALLWRMQRHTCTDGHCLTHALPPPPPKTYSYSPSLITQYTAKAVITH